MAWYDDLFPAAQPGSIPSWLSMLLPANPGTTVPIPPNIMARPNPNFNGQGKDQFNSVRGINEAITGSPFAGLPPNIEARGPGYEIQKPPPTAAPPMMGRSPAAAAMPMPGMLPEGQSPPGAMGMGDLAYPGAMTPAASPPAERPGFFERNKDVFGPEGRLWGPLGARGRGMAQPSPYGAMGQLSQGFGEASQAAFTDPMRRAQLKLMQAQVGEVEEKTNVRKQAQALAKSLPKDHPARSYFALGLVEKGLEQLTPDYNKLIVVGPDGKPQLNATLMNAKAYIEAAGKWSWGVTGHDVGGKPIHGWVNPMQGAPGAAPAAPIAPGSAPPSYAPSSPGVATTSAPPGVAPTPPTRGADAVPPPPPGVDPYKWAEEQAKLRIQQQANEKGRKERAPIVLQDIDRALDAIKGQGSIGMRTGLPGVLARQIPGTGADRLESVLDGVRAQIGFDQLNQMRQQSPTGAALGSVTEKELHFLQSVMGSLRIGQGDEQLSFNLRRLKNAMLDVIHGPGQGPAREKLAMPTGGKSSDDWQDMGDGFRVRRK